VIDTGENTVTNTGTLVSSGTGGLYINSDLMNDGLLWANNGDLAVAGNVTGNGSALINGVAALEFGAAFDQSVVFDNDAAGTLKLGDSDLFQGVLSGFDGNDVLNLADVDFAAGPSVSYVGNQDGTGGTLTVTDGVDTALIDLVGEYEAAGFTASADAGTGTLIEYVLTGLTPTT
jgi:hypothetical protein